MDDVDKNIKMQFSFYGLKLKYIGGIDGDYDGVPIFIGEDDNIYCLVEGQLYPVESKVVKHTFECKIKYKENEK